MTERPFAPSLGRRDALRQLETMFAASGLREASADARILLEEATGLRRFALLAEGDGPLGEAAADRLAIWVPRRLAREPVFRILGLREFWGLALRVTPDVLDPRPDSESVVGAALHHLGPRRAQPLRVLDLGTGTGALLCAVLAECQAATGVGVDRSPAACSVARLNLEACGLAPRAVVVEGDWTGGLAERFDCILCNPPYIPAGDLAGLDPEVRDFDPPAALDGGPDGMDAYRSILPCLPDVLTPDGVAVFEVGAGQATAVAALVEAAGLRLRDVSRDLGGHERVVVASLAMASGAT